jgi:serine/threonine-protein kinase
VSDLLNELQAAVGDAYRVERELARGGMSRLFMATEASLNRRVVIKLLPPEMVSEVSAARFKREIAVAAQLQHPNVLPVLSAGASDGLIFYVMPYVEGESLRHRLQAEGKLSIEFALQILGEVADALAYAHQHGVVHRDIKPENILLLQDHAVLTDFGVARAVEEAREGTRLTAVGAAVGTPGYMSPEQAAGDHNLDARTDVYALAVVGFEMLSGEQPFTGATPQSVMAAHLTQDPRPVSDLRPEAPAPVVDAIARGLAKDPLSRYQTSGEFRDALRAAATPTAASAPARAWKLAAGALAAVLVAALVFTLWPRGYHIEGDPRQSIVFFPFENRTGAAENDYLEEASMNLLGLAVGHWEDMRVYDDERTSSLMRRRSLESAADIDFDAAQDMAQDARVGTFVLGDIRRERDSIAVEAKVHDVATGERIATEIVRAGAGADPRPLFDSLAARLLHVSGAPTGEVPGLTAQTTRSLEAYRAYLAGIQALQLLEIDSARAHLERAVAIDSTFALAYMRLVDADGWAGLERTDPQSRRALIAKVQRYSETLPPRYRMLARFYAAFDAGQYARAREITEQMIARDSGDVEAWYQFGEAHFHDGAQTFPHADSAGNLGTALNAFRRALQLDSAYVLAYLHITQVLGSCGGNNPWLCLRDSAVYAPQDSLVQGYGQRRVERIREAARDARVEATYAWVEAAPASPRARAVLLGVLIEQERFEEAESQVAVLRAEGRGAPADGWDAWLALRQGEYSQAGLLMREAVADDRAALQLMTELTPDWVFGALGAAAMIEEARRVLTVLLAAVPQDSVSGGGGALYTKDQVTQFALLGALAAISADSTRLSEAGHAWLDLLAREYERGTDGYQRRLTASSSTILLTYMGSRDTTLLSRFLADVDTTGSRTWHTMVAHLALERGDTTTARHRLDIHFYDRDTPELSGAPGRRRHYAWADLLVQLGELRAAAEAYQLFDELESIGGEVVLVRAWAELGALYQQLGEGDRAIEMYERFIAAWENGGGPAAGGSGPSGGGHAAGPGVRAATTLGRYASPFTNSLPVHGKILDRCHPLGHCSQASPLRCGSSETRSPWRRWASAALSATRIHLGSLLPWQT